MENKYKIIMLLLLSYIFHSFAMYFLGLSNITSKEFIGLILFTIHIFILIDIIDIIKKPKVI